MVTIIKVLRQLRVSTPEIRVYYRAWVDMSRNDTLKRSKRPILNNSQKYTPLLGSFNTTEYPNAVDSVTSVILSFSKFRLVYFDNHTRTPNAIVHFVQ